MSLLLHIIVTYIKENIITKLQKLYSLPRNLRAGNKLPMLFVKKPLCTGNSSPACTIFIERPALGRDMKHVNLEHTMHLLNMFASMLYNYTAENISFWKHFLNDFIFCASFSWKSMPSSGCSALHGVNLN